jgi:hypothetical protein
MTHMAIKDHGGQGYVICGQMEGLAASLKSSEQEKQLAPNIEKN